ncbi:hypothetical protein LQK89_07090 [Curtobacterium sp. C1]|uniref:Uncharacterized protein n=1 Tax=Curtobacterium citreum TaxID=2036 RepID=A0A850DWI7_9MICO|nr:MULTISPECIES: hypothetical protein [Curtobacterium]NUU28808.1 hypothetical protein [Curtobacterium albidum]QKS16680.1 hypothetical protein HUN59_11035 [Curtobacterium sp. Csp2]RDH96455.1 hypothetical protein DEU32_10968 [Curtobacterium sp. AG1037]UFU15446.1 hypothetical protein LQK89_07090 [Curtobacterium sp. C1]WIJ46729.1 hypothetical protein QPK07_07150 [Curtobacterium citreum]
MVHLRELSELQRHPHEWHRRGMRHPDEIDALVHHRTIGDVPQEPSYGDFFRAV